MYRTTYSDGSREHEAIHIPWEEVTEILGEPHDGKPSQDERLVAHLRYEGAPAWIEDAEGWVDEDGWGLIGPPSIGARVREAREDAGLSQVALAEALGRDQPYISRLEAGEHQPQSHTIRALARALDVSADWLLGLTD